MLVFHACIALVFILLPPACFASSGTWNFENEDTETFTTTLFTEAQAREFYDAGLTAERIDCDLEFRVQRDNSQSGTKFSFMTLHDGQIFNIDMRGRRTNHQYWKTVDGDCTKITCYDYEQSRPRGNSGYCPQAFYDGTTPKEFVFLLLKVEFDPFERNQGQPRRNRYTFKGTTYNVEPTIETTESSTIEPTLSPTIEPTGSPTIEPTGSPTMEPTKEPTTLQPTLEPTLEPTMASATMICCDGSTPTCSDGSTSRPCPGGSPVCNDGSSPQLQCAEGGDDDAVGGDDGGSDSETGSTCAVVPDLSNIKYSDASERNVLDLYHASGTGPHPLIIFTHGGGWARNDKCSINPGIVGLTNSGYSVASINYRYAQDASFPAPISDAKAAVRFLRANAATYNLDPNRFISMGESAGGMLASMLGTSIGVETFEDATLGNAGISSAVQLSVTFYGPQDFPNQNVDLVAAGCAETSGRSIGSVIDCQDFTVASCRDSLVQVSPVTHVNGNEPPFMILQGTADCTVGYGQAQRLSDALTNVGVENELILVDGGEHTFGSIIGGGNYARLRNFLDRHMMARRRLDTAEQQEPVVEQQVPVVEEGRPVSATFPDGTSTEAPVDDLVSEDVDVAEFSVEKRNWYWILIGASAATLIISICHGFPDSRVTLQSSKDAQMEDAWNNA